MMVITITTMAKPTMAAPIAIPAMAPALNFGAVPNLVENSIVVEPDEPEREVLTSRKPRG